MNELFNSTIATTVPFFGLAAPGLYRVWQTEASR
jgi:hypothetical protein